jgi:hypothetical protein
MALLDAGVDTAIISLWLGHESTRSTQPAHLAVKEAAMARPHKDCDSFTGAKSLFELGTPARARSEIPAVKERR